MGVEGEQGGKVQRGFRGNGRGRAVVCSCSLRMLGIKCWFWQWCGGEKGILLAFSACGSLR
jgi:hypothetical protein